MRPSVWKPWQNMTHAHGRALAIFLLFVLIGVAVSLGLAIVKEPAVHKNEIKGERPVAPLTAQGKDLSADEKALLRTPQKGATEAEKAAHFAVVNRLARTAEFLDLSACFGNPLSFRVVEGATFTVKNNAAVAHTLQISPKYIYTIPAKGERKLVAKFGFGPGVYGYGCDDSPDARGILLVTK